MAEESLHQTSQRCWCLPQPFHCLSEPNLYNAVQWTKCGLCNYMFRYWLSYLLIVTLTSLRFSFLRCKYKDKIIYLAGLLLRFKNSSAMTKSYMHSKIFLSLLSCRKENHNILSLSIPTFYHLQTIHSLCIYIFTHNSQKRWRHSIMCFLLSFFWCLFPNFFPNFQENVLNL